VRSNVASKEKLIFERIQMHNFQISCTPKRKEGLCDHKETYINTAGVCILHILFYIVEYVDA